MAVLDRLILRMAISELLRDPETPAAVVINEALELARTFSSEESVRFINGMLDAARKQLDAFGCAMTHLDAQTQQRRSNVEELSNIAIDIYSCRFERRQTVDELVVPDCD